MKALMHQLMLSASRYLAQDVANVVPALREHNRDRAVTAYRTWIGDDRVRVTVLVERVPDEGGDAGA